MTHPGKARTAFKRGALLVAANWQVVAIQSVADSTFKILVAVPILGGALLATLLLDRDVGEIFAGSMRDTLLSVAGTLAAHPVALASYLAGLLAVVAGGVVLMFLVKGGTVSVLVQADRGAGAIEQPPLRMPAFRRGMQFSIEGFTRGASDLFRRYLGLGLLLMAVYTAAAGLCLLLAYGLYRLGAGDRPVLVGSVAALAFALFFVITTLVNVLYLLAQIALTVRDSGVARALAEVPRFIRGGDVEGDARLPGDGPAPRPGDGAVAGRRVGLLPGRLRPAGGYHRPAPATRRVDAAQPALPVSRADGPRRLPFPVPVFRGGPVRRGIASPAAR